MTDEGIIGLFCARSEDAVREAESRYGAYCLSIAENILRSREDAEECLADALLGAWNAIPPAKPEKLGAFLGRLTRNAALKKVREQNAEKRGGGELALALDELAECIPGRDTVERELDARAFGELMNRFLASLPETQRKVFVCRYWYLEPVGDISRRFGFSESKTKSMLLRVRGKLMKMLKKEGVEI